LRKQSKLGVSCASWVGTLNVLLLLGTAAELNVEVDETAEEEVMVAVGTTDEDERMLWVVEEVTGEIVETTGVDVTLATEDYH